MYSVALLTSQKFNCNLLLVRLRQRNLIEKRFYILESRKLDAGFSLVEMIAVVLMIGILAAIALPSWSAYVNRQRVTKANEVVLSAIQDAQRQAKQKKLSYSVSFKTDNNIPQLAVYSGITPTNWRNLGEDLDIKTGTMRLGTNLSNVNTASTSVTYAANFNTSAPQTITFDYMGTLANANLGTLPTGSDEAPGIKVVVANNNIKRCVILKTLLGATLTDKDDKCN
ncbi:type IV pilin protein [Anabaena sp. CCY 9910]|uniref:type IV pilin protein n=1 Tax=Anabaena sp. CCY 9910 TaxID=3103870 RepID=UPI0039E032E6